MTVLGEVCMVAKPIFSVPVGTSCNIRGTPALADRAEARLLQTRR